MLLRFVSFQLVIYVAQHKWLTRNPWPFWAATPLPKQAEILTPPCLNTYATFEVSTMYREFEIKPTESTCKMRISDRLFIHTRNSVYEFFVIDPLRAYGLVRGGIIGKRGVRAFIYRPDSLKLGSKASLFVESKGGLRFITTSTITSVKHLRE